MMSHVSYRRILKMFVIGVGVGGGMGVGMVKEVGAAPDCGPEWVVEKFVIPKAPDYSQRLEGVWKRKIAFPEKTIRPEGERYVMVNIECDEDEDGLQPPEISRDPDVAFKNVPPQYTYLVPPEIGELYVWTPPDKKVNAPGALWLLMMGFVMILRQMKAGRR